MTEAQPDWTVTCPICEAVFRPGEEHTAAQIAVHERKYQADLAKATTAHSQPADGGN